MTVERLAVEKVSRSFGGVRALRNVSLTCEAGQVTALLGGNGAGKSTLMKILATLTRPDSGRVLLDEFDVRDDVAAARGQIGYVAHDSMLDASLTGRENLHLFASLYNAPRERAQTLIDQFDAASFADRPVHTYSRGQEQKLALCRALLHDPAVLLLDEPSTGLDSDAQDGLWRAVREQAKQGRVVLFSTHDKGVRDDVPDARFVLKAGELV